MKLNELKTLIQQIWLQEAIAAGIKQIKNPFKAMFIFGPAGAGKTFLLKQLGVPDNFYEINTDHAVEKVFPKFNLSLKFQEGTEEEKRQKQEVRKLLQQAVSDKTVRKLNQGVPLVFDTTGENPKKMRRMMRALVEIGYDIAIFQINVPPVASVHTDKNRGRTVGAEITRQISNDYQKNIATHGAYAAMAEERGITLLSANVYPNLFDLRTGKIRDDLVYEKDKETGKIDKTDPIDPPLITPKTFSEMELNLKGPKGEEIIHNPFYGASREKALAILEEAKGNLANWLSDPAPQNPVGRFLLGVLSDIQDRGIRDYGDQLTDIIEYVFWAKENDQEVSKDIERAAQLIFAIEPARKEKAVPSRKHPISPQKVKTAKGEKEVPPHLLPSFGQIGAPTIQQLTREELRHLIQNIIKEIKT
tara:strand:+ start:3622 stop:4875 length:1254 start_codon:yes stop_codon:yes gene_type:complete